MPVSWTAGYRERALDIRLDTLNLRVPKLRQGSYFPAFVEAWKTSDQALVAVIPAPKVYAPGAALGGYADC